MESVAVRFNECINGRDIDGLAALMTYDHRFVDTDGAVVEGRADCLDAWRGFFALFPDYRNSFAAVTVRGEVETIVGRSTCSEPALDGPALWRATVCDGRVVEWRVYADTPAVREQLGLEAGQDAGPAERE